MTPSLHLTDHALHRMAQRNISSSDIELIMAIGSEVEGGFLVRKKDCQVVERLLKTALKRVQRLAGKRLVVTNDCVVTAYRASRSEERRLLRGASLSSQPNWGVLRLLTQALPVPG